MSCASDGVTLLTKILTLNNSDSNVFIISPLLNYSKCHGKKIGPKDLDEFGFWPYMKMGLIDTADKWNRKRLGYF